MLPIARRHHHYVFAVLQSGLTTLIASGIASFPMIAESQFLANWLWSSGDSLDVDGLGGPDGGPNNPASSRCADTG